MWVGKGISIFLSIFLLLSPVFAWTPGTTLLGPGDGVIGGPASDNLSTNGQDAANTWKAFRWQAGRSGEIYMWAIRIESIPGSVSDEDLAFAVYEDSGGSIGSLKAWGYRLHYNWHTIGIGRHYFDLTNVVTNRNVVAGRYYWIAFRTSVGNVGKMYFERQGSDPLPAWVSKRGVVVSGGFDQMPPTGSTYDINYATNYYGWSVWSASGGGNQTPPAAPTGLRIGQ